jgi:hypothetical protein
VLQIPGFRDKVLAAPAVVALFGYQLESCAFVNAACGSEFALGPEQDLLVPGFPRESDAYFD